MPDASRLAIVALTGLLWVSAAGAAGTTAVTDIANTAEVSFDVSGSSLTETSNTIALTVEEDVDVDVTLQSAAQAVSPGDGNQELLFTITNTGNDSEAFSRAPDNADGSRRRARADNYTHIRWKMRNALQPGKQEYARFRAELF